MLSIRAGILKPQSFNLCPFLTLSVRNGPSVSLGSNVPCIVHALCFPEFLIFRRCLLLLLKQMKLLKKKIVFPTIQRFDLVSTCSKISFYVILAEGTGVARGKKNFWKKCWKKISNFFSPIYECPQKKFSPIGPAVWLAIGNIIRISCFII